MGLQRVRHDWVTDTFTFTDLGGSSSSVVSFCLLILFMEFLKQECWSGLPFPPPLDHVLSELSTVTCSSWWPCMAWLMASSVWHGCDPWRGCWYIDLVYPLLPLCSISLYTCTAVYPPSALGPSAVSSVGCCRELAASAGLPWHVWVSLSLQYISDYSLGTH